MSEITFDKEMKTSQWHSEAKPFYSESYLCQWQPIETAPKDGSKFIGWSEADGTLIWFLGRDWWWATESKAVTDPTHWMPLPPPPDS